MESQLTVPVPIARTGLIRRMSNRLAGVGPSSLPSRLAELAFDLDLAPAGLGVERQHGAVVEDLDPAA